MKEFFVSYNNEVLKPSLAWTKKHWKGYIIFIAAVSLAEFGIMYGEQIVDSIKEKIDEKKN